MSRIRIKIAGESGAGLLSAGEIITRALKNMGFYVVADREYPSLIKGICGSCACRLDGWPGERDHHHRGCQHESLARTTKFGQGSGWVGGGLGFCV